VEMVPASCLTVFLIYFSVKYLKEEGAGIRKQQEQET